MNVERLQVLNAKISSVRYQIVLVIDHKDVHICNCDAETKRNRIKEKIISIDKRNQHNYLPKKMLCTILSSFHYNALT